MPEAPIPAASLLLTDLYQLNMLEAHLSQGRTETAVFEFFVRRLPPRRGFLMAAGLQQAVEYLQTLRVSAEELDWLRGSGRFSTGTLDWLSGLRFTGELDAVAEGTVIFGDEPILRVTAPLPVAQLVESRLMNILHFQTLVASKAARMVLAAPGKRLVDFGLRRAHGAEAGLMAARASYIAGFHGTATTLAGMLWDIPVSGTMAHAFIQAFDDESEAFEAFARARPEGLTLLLDTYDTEEGARKVVALAPRLRQAGIAVRGVRLDSGDLIVLSRSVTLPAAPLLLDVAMRFHDEPLCVLSPDPGGAKRAELFREALEAKVGKPVGKAFADKHRSAGVVSGELLIGDVRDATVLLIDDLVSTGGTLVRAARAARAAGARRIIALAAHGLFMPGAAEALADPAIERVVITDAVPPFRLEGRDVSAKVEVISCAPLLAEAVARLATGQALNDLLAY